ncbi:unnamed protein product [Closterium sp. NIES-54]
MLALCQEHRLEHRTKHIALRYFLARELQQRGQLRLAYVASRANTADIFTKALQPCDHQRFCTMLGFSFVPTLPACLLPAAACLQPAYYLPAACLVLAACCSLPACCLLPPACSLPATCLLPACCLLPPACLLPAAACL